MLISHVLRQAPLARPSFATIAAGFGRVSLLPSVISTGVSIRAERFMNHEGAWFDELLLAYRALEGPLRPTTLAFSRMGVTSAAVAEKLPTLPAAVGEVRQRVGPSQMLSQ